MTAHAMTGGVPRASSQTAAWTLIAVVGLFLLLVGGTQPAAGLVIPGVISHICVGALLTGWAFVGYRSASWRRVGALAPAIVIALGAMTMSVLLSPVPRIAVAGLVGALALALAYLFLVCVAADAWMGPRLRAFLVVLPIAVSVAYIASVSVEWLRFWDLAGGLTVPPLRPSFTALSFGSPNYVATIVIGLTPLAALTAVANGRIVLAGAIAGLGLIVVALTGARAAMIGSVLAAFVVIGLTLLYAPKGARLSRGRWPVTVLAALSLVGVVVAQRLGQGGVSIRLDLWQTALAVFTTHPHTGGGPTTWPILGPAASGAIERTYAAPHAHNLYVQTLAEGGLLGVIAAAVLILSLCRLIAVRVRSQDQGVSLAAIGAAAGIVAVAVQSVTDVPTMLPMITLPLVALVATVEGSGEPLAFRLLSTKTASRRLWATAWAAGTLLAVPFGIASDVAWAYADQAKVAADVGDWSAARSLLDVSVAVDPLPLYREQLAIAETHGGDRLRALKLLDEVLAVDPLPQPRITRAYLLHEMGRDAEALADATIARERAVGDAVALVNVSRIAELTGDDDLAFSAAADAIAAAPPLVADPWWLDPARGFDRERLIAQAASRAAVLTGTEQAALVHAFAGDRDLADATALKLEASRLTVVRAIIETVAGSREKGLADLRDVVARQPLDWYADAWLSILTRDGDRSGSTRL